MITTAKDLKPGQRLRRPDFDAEFTVEQTAVWTNPAGEPRVLVELTAHDGGLLATVSYGPSDPIEVIIS